MDVDINKCIKFLLDRGADEGHREDAADTIVQLPSNDIADVFIKVIIDDSEHNDFRREIAGCLGSVCRDIGIECTKLESVPKQFKNELLHEYNLKD